MSIPHIQSDFHSVTTTTKAATLILFIKLYQYKIITTFKMKCSNTESALKYIQTTYKNELEPIRQCRICCWKCCAICCMDKFAVNDLSHNLAVKPKSGGGFVSCKKRSMNMIYYMDSAPLISIIEWNLYIACQLYTFDFFVLVFIHMWISLLLYPLPTVQKKRFYPFSYESLCSFPSNFC